MGVGGGIAELNLGPISIIIPTRQQSSPEQVIGQVGDVYCPISMITQIILFRALEILKSESVQPMTMTSSMSPFPKKKICIYHLSRKLMTIGSLITPFK